MKTIRNIIYIWLVIGILGISGCDKDEPGMNPIELQKELISSGTWNVNSVIVSGIDISSAFTGTTISFQSGGDYVTTIDLKFAPIWPASGKWSINTLDIVIVNNIEMNITNATSGSLTLDFAYTTSEAQKGGKLSSLDGNYVMLLSR